MEYRRLGNSGLQVSVIGLGAVTFGSTCDAVESASMLDAALAAGVNTIDTSDSYGAGVSEEYIGNAMSSRRDKWIVMTKFASRMGEGPNRAGASRGYIRQAVEASLRRLGTDYIDVYQVHRPDPETPAEETMSALHDLVTAGKVRYIGCSNYAGWQVARANEVATRHGWTPFVASQARYNLLERAIEREHIPSCEAYGLGLIPYSPLAGGFLTGKYKRGADPPEGTRYVDRNHSLFGRVFTKRNLDLLDALSSFAAARGLSLTELAIGWLVARPINSTVIVGATHPEQIAENAAAGEVLLSTEDLVALDELTSA